MRGYGAWQGHQRPSKDFIKSRMTNNKNVGSASWALLSLPNEQKVGEQMQNFRVPRHANAFMKVIYYITFFLPFIGE